MAHGGKYTQIGDAIEMTDPLEDIVDRGGDNRDRWFDSWEWKALAMSMALFLVLVLLDVMAAIGVEQTRTYSRQDTFEMRGRW